ncbi:MAG: ABC transporter transmembrane domain-containing protein, partial [Gammaproteobacteria bacterium]|nr:ABC transporter transmembrane domain-containing protein [Gammaproteobacteria bacterium]
MKSAKHDTNGAAIYRRLLTYAWPYKWVFVMAVAGMICAALAETSFVALQKPLMDRGFVARDESFIRYIPLIWVGIFLARGIAEFVDNYCMQWLGRRVVLDLRRHMFDRFTRMPARFYDENSSASLVSKLIYDVEQVLGASTTALRILIRDTLLTVALLGWMVYLNIRLTLVFVVVAPIVALLVSIANKRFRTTSQRIQTTMGGIAHVAKEAFQSHRVVKSFGGHDYEMAAFQRENNRNRQQAMKRAAISAASVPVIMQIIGIAIAIIIYIATTQTGTNLVSPGTFVSYLTAML